MAYTIITERNSLIRGLEDADGAAQLFVDTGGYIAAHDQIGYRSIGGDATVTVKGSILSDTANGISFYNGGANNDRNVVRILATGLVQGYNAILAFGDSNLIDNQGTIASSVRGGDGIAIYGSDNRINNSGQVSGNYAIYNGGALTIDNRGHIDGALYAVFGLNGTTIANSGSITGDVHDNTMLDLRNNGRIEGLVSGQYGADIVYNSGYIASVALAEGGDTLTNAAGGVIAGDVAMGDSANQQDLADTLTNSGLIGGTVSMGDGNDTVDTALGTITGLVSLDGGDDRYTGGVGQDRVDGGTGSDTIDLGAGNDVYRARNGDGKDMLDGGAGSDRYDASDVGQALVLDLGAGVGARAVGADLIVNFEDATGGKAADILIGAEGANRLDGGSGADLLDGDAGADRLIGGRGADTIVGGSGRDWMTGGLVGGSVDSDVFRFSANPLTGSDITTGATAATRDVITDFTDHGGASGPFNRGADVIDLSAIDASPIGGDQAFSFNPTEDAAFSGSAGSLIWDQRAGFALVLGDINGDGRADFAIQLNGAHTLFASDFVL